MKIQINLSNGTYVTLTTTADFNFEMFCMSIRESGRLLSRDLYIPCEAILSIHQVGAPDVEVKNWTIQ